MSKARKKYVCQSCGSVAPQWAGKCDECSAWNSIVEELSVQAAPKSASGSKGNVIPFTNLDGGSDQVDRIITSNSELNRVCGGGLVPGSAILLGGDPGIGKSTLLLQLCSALSTSNLSCVYISGEESVNQIRLRAQRLGLEKAPISLASATSLEDILTTLDRLTPQPDLVIIDSIQTMYTQMLDAPPGTVSQVRTCAQDIIRQAKNKTFTVILVGHVTKEGTLAGPRVLEHMVDTVLYFEGERNYQFRILRAVKNRFGAANEIGIFEMTQLGLMEVTNPSALFLSESTEPTSGTAVFAGIEGSRPVLMEIQALLAPSNLATPRRTVVGWDSGRLSMVMAVLESRCGVKLSTCDVYLNIAGGLRISEPAADLAVAAALLSSARNKPIPEGTVIFGEISLSGEVRNVNQRESRLKEAEKLGFKKILCPPDTSRSKSDTNLKIKTISHLKELINFFDL